MRTYRQRRLWSQQQLADRCNLSVRTIRNLERGIGHPRHDSVRLLAAAFELSEAQHAQLSQAAWEATPATGPAAKQLPPDLPDFIGRAAEVEAVSGQLQDRPGTVPVVVLAGKPGVGKTALALHVAHRVADRFPDGHLYADLRGAGADPLEPATVLHRFLQALGLDGSAIPADPEEREAVYRAALADLRVLVVLDDAGRAAQVRPLLPGSPGCGVLVTGRTRLPGLAGAQVVDVDVPDPDEGVELLAGMAGRARVEADPEVARGIIDRCGRLPLAVRVAGARLSGRPNWPLHRLLSLLDDETGRLDQLAAGDLEVRASLALSYRGLAEPVRRAFRLIGAADVGDFSPWLLAPLLDVPVAEAERMVDRLVDACLIDPVTRDGADRYRFHELVRVYARECSGDEDPALLRAAFERLTGCWLALAEEADGLLPTTSDIVTVGPAPRWRLAAEETEKILADPVGWFDLERDNLVAAIRAAAATGPAGSAWELTGTLCAWAGLRNDYAALEGVQASVAAACRLAGDVRGETAMALIRQLTAIDRSDAEAALGATRSARSTFRRLGDEYGEARALLALAVGVHRCGDPQGEHRFGLQALRLARRIGHRGLELMALQVASRAAEQLGRVPEAAAGYERALTLARSLGAVENEADALWHLAKVARQEGDRERAVALLERALALTRRIGNRTGEALVLAALGETLLDCGRLADARERLAESLAARPRTDRRFDLALIRELSVRLELLTEDSSPV